MGPFVSPYLLQTGLQALLSQVRQCWVHIDDILIWGKEAEDVIKRVETAANFRINTKKSQLLPRRTIHYCGLAFEAGKRWDFTPDNS